MNNTLEGRVINELESGGRILVSRLQFLGDVILTLPLVEILRQRFPAASIDYLARGVAADVIAGEPTLDVIHRLGEGSNTSLVRGMRQRRYSVAIDLYSNPRTAWLTRLTGAAMRIGGSRRMRRRLYTHPVEVPATVRSAMEFHIEHLKPLRVTGQPSKPALHPSDTETDTAATALSGLGVDLEAPVVGIHPGGKWEVKRWPADLFAELATRLIAEYGMQVLILQGPGEDVYVDSFRQHLGAGADEPFYMPVRPIRETAAVLRLLDGMVVSDGGIMHVSVAVGTPTVGIFGSAEPDVWFPYESFGPYVAAHVPITCRPCHSHHCYHISCLRRLTTRMVEERLLEVMAKQAGKSNVQ